MNDPDYDLDAYASGVHSYIPLSRNWWYRLVITVDTTSQTYDVTLRDASGSNYTYGQLAGIPFDNENIDSATYSEGTDGRLFFGSWFEDGSANSSYGHVYIDSIRVLQ